MISWMKLTYQIQGRWKQLCEREARVRKVLLINIHKEGVFRTFTRSRQLKWLFVWSLQLLFAAVHSAYC